MWPAYDMGPTVKCSTIQSQWSATLTPMPGRRLSKILDLILSGLTTTEGDTLTAPFLDLTPVSMPGTGPRPPLPHSLFWPCLEKTNTRRRTTGVGKPSFLEGAIWAAGVLLSSLPAHFLWRRAVFEFEGLSASSEVTPS